MIVDSSAVLAMVLNEPEQASFTLLLDSASAPRISAGSLVELAAVSTRRFGGRLDKDIADLLAAFRISIAPVTSDQALIGRDAYREYGIGTGHPAGLNFGDCFAYALATATGEPLLFKGDDFVHTDVRRAVGDPPS